MEIRRSIADNLALTKIRNTESHIDAPLQRQGNFVTLKVFHQLVADHVRVLGAPVHSFENTHSLWNSLCALTELAQNESFLELWQQVMEIFVVSLSYFSALIIHVDQAANCTLSFEEVGWLAQVQSRTNKFDQSFDLLVLAVVKSFDVVQPLLELKHLMTAHNQSRCLVGVQPRKNLEIFIAFREQKKSQQQVAQMVHNYVHILLILFLHAGEQALQDCKWTDLHYLMQKLALAAKLCRRFQLLNMRLLVETDSCRLIW